jgi:hypothetical protein
LAGLVLPGEPCPRILAGQGPLEGAVPAGVCLGRGEQQGRIIVGQSETTKRRAGKGGTSL